MLCSTISIFGNKIFSEILSEMKLFSKYKVKYYDDIDLCIKNAEINNEFSKVLRSAQAGIIKSQIELGNIYFHGLKL